MTFISYAQNNEDVMLHRALKDVDEGFYIDVGANSPVVDSVTKAFYDAGWHGINIEPVGEWFEMLEQERPRDINLQLAAGERKGMVEFHEIVGSGLSTMSESIARQHAKNYSFEQQTRKVPAARLASICKQYAPPVIHFLKIDVEGGEMSVLKGMDFRTFRPWIVLVESTLPGTQLESHDEWSPILLENDYHFVYFDGLNRFYIADEHRDLDKFFGTPPNVFDEFVRANEATLLESARKLQNALELERTSNQAQVKELQDAWDSINASLAERDRDNAELSATLQQSQNTLVKLQDDWEAINAGFVASQRENASLKNTVQQLLYDDELNRARLVAKDREKTKLHIDMQQLNNEKAALINMIQQYELDKAKLSDDARQMYEEKVELSEANRELYKNKVELSDATRQLYEDKVELSNLVQQLDNELRKARMTLDDLERSVQYWMNEAGSAQHELQVVYDSTSWTVTSPLRKMRSFIARLLHGEIASANRDDTQAPADRYSELPEIDPHDNYTYTENPASEKLQAKQHPEEPASEEQAEVMKLQELVSEEQGTELLTKELAGEEQVAGMPSEGPGSEQQLTVSIAEQPASEEQDAEMLPGELPGEEQVAVELPDLPGKCEHTADTLSEMERRIYNVLIKARDK